MQRIGKGMEVKKVDRKGGVVMFLGLLAAVAMLACAAGAFTMARGEAVVAEETERYLAELSQQTAYKIDQRLSFNLELLQNVGRQLEIMADSEEAREAAVGAVVDASPFVWIGTTDYEGVLTVPGVGTMDTSDLDVVVHALAGEPGVSSGLVETFEGERGAVYAVPAPGDNSVGAVVGFVLPSTMELLMDTDTADGVGFSHIVSSAGDFILRSDNPNALLKGENVFEALEERSNVDADKAAVMERDLLQGASGSISFSIDGQERALNYRPLEYGGWYVLSVVPPATYTSSFNDFVRTSLGATAFLTVVLFALFGACLMRIMSRNNRELARIAFVDPVTGGHTEARFDQLVRSRMGSGGAFSLVTLDIGNFRLFNDRFGKADGDRLLAHVHRTIASLLGDGEYVARISADVFNLTLEDVDAQAVRSRLRAIADAVNAFNENSDTPYLVKLNCGAYLVDGPTDMVVARDRANTARKSGEAQSGSLCAVSFFSDVEHARLLREKEMENSMERALADGEFIMHLQPKISLETGKTVGAEALVRWESERGLVPPDEFIPFFERNGFVIKIDLCVFEQVCACIRAWIDAGLQPLPVSVNLSPLHLRRPNFLEAFEKVRLRYDVPSDLLEFELTERVAFESLELLRDVVDDIHTLGFRCSMDDFGSGYSSLNVLKEIPVDVLKIDRQFFAGESERAGHVVESVVELAKKLDMGTVAEGVETIPQVEFLRRVDCDMVQGYVFSPPVPVELFEKMVFGDARPSDGREGPTA